jgi:uncharacterized membrane protein YhaH (DUF805 family)
MLGYRGRTDRRGFVLGAVALNLGPWLMWLASRPLIAWIGEAFERNTAVLLLFGLTLVVCVAILAVVWGWSVLVTRRARDIGLPAWAGVVGWLALIPIGFAIEAAWPGLPSGVVGLLLNGPYLAIMALWPGRSAPLVDAGLARRMAALG